MLCTRGKNIKSQEEKGSLREVASLKLIVCALRPACERKTKEEKKEERRKTTLHSTNTDNSTTKQNTSNIQPVKVQHPTSHNITQHHSDVRHPAYTKQQDDRGVQTNLSDSQ
jgi:hypothetical protein